MRVQGMRRGGSLWWLGAIVVWSLAVAGCKRSPPPAPTEKLFRLPTAEDERPKPADYPDEVYGDPKLFSEPRLQVEWSRSEYWQVGTPEEEPYGIWSMKLDGSDLRRTVSLDVLFSGEAKELEDGEHRSPVRSPDGRYIACAGVDAKAKGVRFLVDLKEKKVRTMARGESAAHFNWTPDSKRVIFYVDLEQKQYDVTTGELSPFPEMSSMGLHLVDGGRKFVAVTPRAVVYYDSSGRKLSTVALPYEIDRQHAVSPDGRWMYLSVDGKRRIVSASDPEKPVFEDDGWFVDSAFSPDGQQLFYLTLQQGLLRLDMATKAVSRVMKLPGRPPRQLTIFDVRSTR